MDDLHYHDADRSGLIHFPQWAGTTCGFLDWWSFYFLCEEVKTVDLWSHIIQFFFKIGWYFFSTLEKDAKFSKNHYKICSGWKRRKCSLVNPELWELRDTGCIAFCCSLTGYVLVGLLGLLNKLSQKWLLKKQMCFLTVPEARHKKSFSVGRNWNVSRATLSPEALEKNIFLFLFSFWWPPVFLCL